MLISFIRSSAGAPRLDYRVYNDRLIIYAYNAAEAHYNVPTQRHSQELCSAKKTHNHNNQTSSLSVWRLNTVVKDVLLWWKMNQNKDNFIVSCFKDKYQFKQHGGCNNGTYLLFLLLYNENVCRQKTKCAPVWSPLFWEKRKEKQTQVQWTPFCRCLNQK